MTGARSQSSQQIGGLFAPFWINCFHRMDVVVQCSKMTRILLDHSFEGAQNNRRLFLWLLLFIPVIPGRKIDQRGSIKGGRILIILIFFMKLLHSLRVGYVEGLTVNARIVRIALCESTDVLGLFFGDMLDLSKRSLNSLIGLVDNVILHWQVQVRAQNKSPSPVGHRTVRIKSSGFLKCPQCLPMVEAISQLHPLIKEKLCPFGARCNGMVMFPEPIEDGGDLTGSKTRIRVENTLVVTFVVLTPEDSTAG